MARVNATEWADKHATNLKASTQYIRQGVERVTVAPGVQAAKAKQRLIDNFIAAVNSGDWERKVAGVSLQQWQDSLINKGIPRIAAGVDAARDKSIASAEKLLKNVDTVTAEVKAMPKGSLQDSINRAAHYMTRMKELSAK